MSEPFIKATGLTKSFLKGKQEIVPIKDISFQVNSGEFISLWVLPAVVRQHFLI